MTTTSERVSEPLTRQVSRRVSQSVFDGSPLRVVLLVDVYDGAQQQFLEAYEQLCSQVASVPGHVSDQLCQSIENRPSGSSPASGRALRLPRLGEQRGARADGARHCTAVSGTPVLAALPHRARDGTPDCRPPPPRAGSRRHPGSATARSAMRSPSPSGRERAGGEVAKILQGYASPEARVDEHHPAVPHLAVHRTATGSSAPSRWRATCSQRCAMSPAARGACRRGGDQPVSGGGARPQRRRGRQRSSSPVRRSRPYTM